MQDQVQAVVSEGEQKSIGTNVDYEDLEAAVKPSNLQESEPINHVDEDTEQDAELWSVKICNKISLMCFLAGFLCGATSSLIEFWYWLSWVVLNESYDSGPDVWYICSSDFQLDEHGVKFCYHLLLSRTLGILAVVCIGISAAVYSSLPWIFQYVSNGFWRFVGCFIPPGILLLAGGLSIFSIVELNQSVPDDLFNGLNAIAAALIWFSTFTWTLASTYEIFYEVDSPIPSDECALSGPLNSKS